MNLVALAGGVGGAKLVDGLARCVPPDRLTVIVNTGDDFCHFGLHISPDLDTVCYTLAGIANPDTGWGRMGDTWAVMEEIGRLGGPTWFRLGDRDLATHLERTRRLQQGERLSEVVAAFCQAWGIKVKVLPMSDDPVSTIVLTKEGDELGFQDYFVAQQCQPEVKGFRFMGSETAQPAPGVLEALWGADLVILCPSNPWVSIGPILTLPGVREALMQKPVIAVSPLVGGQALKGPAAKMFRELGWQPSPLAVAHFYQPLLHGILVDNSDAMMAEEIQHLGIIPHVTDIVMRDEQDRIRLAKEAVTFGQAVREALSL
ncbi:2-phospho-L-lactate transferase [Thermanaerothrix daxensis]|uniref:2-phospho-L-lactate transferase n=1 Tax=Thermanaerothrix daxensis TaxID=869279 RepID=A0A0P6Y264_9CHLR|nr:2-phospho-L-lactate transferase [Thermanaerothrix daxensis]KPL83115.1 2-phospho-L-lactate transferase [Thermanaerothrix daxensis]